MTGMSVVFVKADKYLEIATDPLSFQNWNNQQMYIILGREGQNTCEKNTVEEEVFRLFT